MKRTLPGSKPNTAQSSCSPKPSSVIDWAATWIVVTRSSKSSSVSFSHSYPNSSTERSICVPSSRNASLTMSSMSAPLSRNRADAIGLKQIAAVFDGFRPRLVSSVIWAVEMAKRRSSVGFATLVRPSSPSRNPIWRGLERLALALELAQLLQPGLERRMVGDERREAALQPRGDDEELVQALRHAHVLLGDAAHRAGDLDERGGEARGRLGEDGRAAIGGELAVAGERPDQEERDRIDDHRHQQDEHERRTRVVAVVAPSAETAAEHPAE